MIVDDVQRGALHTCIWDFNSQHHPHQLSMAPRPALIEWDRQCTVGSRLPLFAFTSSPDQHRDQPCCGDDTYSVFLETEPPDVYRVHPLAHPGLADKFDLVLGIEDATLHGLHASNVIQWPYGSSSIPVEHWKTSYPKHKLCSIIVSDKNFTVGHHLRHRVVDMIQSEFPGMCDVLGRGYHPIDSKLEGLRDYMFTIVIENSRHGMYMTEKLMDAVAVGVVPISWGSNFATSLFEDAILPWDTLDDLRRILKHLSSALFHEMQPLLQRNLEIARHYVPPEQWLWEMSFVVSCHRFGRISLAWSRIPRCLWDIFPVRLAYRDERDLDKALGIEIAIRIYAEYPVILSGQAIERFQGGGNKAYSISVCDRFQKGTPAVLIFPLYRAAANAAATNVVYF